MSLTHAQKVTLKQHALANQATVAAGAGTVTIASLFAAPLGSGDAELIAAHYNELTAAQYAWHNTRSRMDCRKAILNTAGSANQLDALTGSKRDSLLWAVDDAIDCRLAAVRTSIDDLCGSQNTLKAAILDSFKRLLRNVEKVFSTGGAGTFASPHDYVFEGTVTGNEIADVHGVTI
jgi:hypothetical protein